MECGRLLNRNVHRRAGDAVHRQYQRLNAGRDGRGDSEVYLQRSDEAGRVAGVEYKRGDSAHGYGERQHRFGQIGERRAR